MSVKSDRFWSGFGRVSAVIGTLGAAIGVWSHFLGPSASLKAVVSFGPLDYPPVLNQTVEKVLQLRHSQDLTSLLEEGATPPTTESEIKRKFLLRDKLGEYIDSHIPLELAQYKELGGIWRASISNEGDLQCSAISITLPGAVTALIQPDSGSKVTREVHDVIELGELRPGGRVNVLAWVRSEPSLWAADRVEVTHSKGRGKVELHSQASGVALFVERYVGGWSLLMFSSFGLLIITVAREIINSVASASRERAGQETAGGGAASQETAGGGAPREVTPKRTRPKRKQEESTEKAPRQAQ